MALLVSQAATTMRGVKSLDSNPRLTVHPPLMETAKIRNAIIVRITFSVEQKEIADAALKKTQQAVSKAVSVSQQRRPLGVNIFYALVPLLGAGIKAVLLAGKGSPVGVCISCIIPGVAKQFLGLAVIGAARQKQCQTENGKVSFPASKKSYQNKSPTVARL